MALSMKLEYLHGEYCPIQMEIDIISFRLLRVSGTTKCGGRWNSRGESSKGGRGRHHCIRIVTPI